MFTFASWFWSSIQGLWPALHRLFLSHRYMKHFNDIFIHNFENVKVLVSPFFPHHSVQCDDDHTAVMASTLFSTANWPSPKKIAYLHSLFVCINVCMHQYMHDCVCVCVPSEARRSCQIPWNWRAIGNCKSPNPGAKNLT